MKQLAGCALLLMTLLACAFAQSGSSLSSPSGLDLLQQVSRHYAEAKSYRIEASEETTTTSDFEQNWQKIVLTAAEAPGNRYHFGGRSEFGGAMHVSDGTKLWNYHSDEHTYTANKIPDESTAPQQPLSWAEVASLRAQNIRKGLGELATHYNSAERLPDTSLVIDGHEISCYVVHVKSSDRKRSLPSHASEETFWIDKNHQTIVKSLDQFHTYKTSGSARIPMEGEIKTTYSVVELNTPLPDSLFTFEPPSDAKLLQNFPNPVNSMAGADFTGQTVPSVKLKSYDGKLISLDSFRGKPVLLDFWATWCPPCVKGLPQLNQIYQETKDEGLTLLTVDTDEEAKNAADLLAKGGYQWQNFHDAGNVSDAFGVNGIPRTLLIDADGKVVFDKINSGDSEVRAAIAKLGPDYAFLAPKAEPVPCLATK